MNMCYDPTTKIPSLIFENVNNIDFRTLFPILDDYDIRFYIYQLLGALDYAHSNGFYKLSLFFYNLRNYAS